MITQNPYAKANARLLMELLGEHMAHDYVDEGWFHETPPNWHCPACYRDKREIARLTENKKLVCRIVAHHDHFGDFASDKLRTVIPFNMMVRSAIEESLTRFPPTLICEDCNNADDNAKRQVKAPKEFSFAPHEIASFIEVRANEKHIVDPERAMAAFDAVRPIMTLIAKRMRAFKAAQETGEWQPLAQSVLRIMERVSIAEMDEAAE